MRIDKTLCGGCGECAEHCTIGHISTRRRDEKTGRFYYEINEDECVECGCCLRADVCKTKALHQPTLDYPRVLRAFFSDPMTSHPGTQVYGRGTEEIKTMEVTRRIPDGHVCIACEMGRPSVGARFSEVEKMTVALAGLGVEFEHNNPCTQVMEDQSKGTFKAEVRDEKVLSAIIEMMLPLEQAEEVLHTIREVGATISCPFSVDLITLLDENGTSPAAALLQKLQWTPRPNVKLNTGLGRRVGEQGARS